MDNSKANSKLVIADGICDDHWTTPPHTSRDNIASNETNRFKTPRSPLLSEGGDATPRVGAQLSFNGFEDDRRQQESNDAKRYGTPSACRSPRLVDACSAVPTFGTMASE